MGPVEPQSRGEKGVGTPAMSASVLGQEGWAQNGGDLGNDLRSPLLTVDLESSPLGRVRAWLESPAHGFEANLCCVLCKTRRYPPSFHVNSHWIFLNR